MKRDIVDELRFAAPEVAATSEFGRDRQREKLCDAIAAQRAHLLRGAGSGQSVTGVVRRTRRRHYLVGAAAAVAAVAVALPLSLGSPPPASAAVVLRAGAVTVHVTLPRNYRTIPVTASSCASASVGVAWSSPSTSASQTGTFSASTPSYAAAISSAANAEGGCVAMALAQPYTPTSVNPDPEAGTYEDAPTIAVGAFEGHDGTWTSYSKPSGAATLNAWLDVEIPMANGQTRDLIVSGYGLSVSALVALVSDGISTSGAD